jgi:hypothetical protein
MAVKFPATPTRAKKKTSGRIIAASMGELFREMTAQILISVTDQSGDNLQVGLCAQRP